MDWIEMLAFELQECYLCLNATRSEPDLPMARRRLLQMREILEKHGGEGLFYAMPARPQE